MDPRIITRSDIEALFANARTSREAVICGIALGDRGAAMELAAKHGDTTDPAHWPATTGEAWNECCEAIYRARGQRDAAAIVRRTEIVAPPDRAIPALDALIDALGNGEIEVAVLLDLAASACDVQADLESDDVARWDAWKALATKCGELRDRATAIAGKDGAK